jgi:PadR family transcriptional regulator, regulatory protein PadR
MRILEGGVELQRDNGSFYGFGIARELASGEGSSLISHGTLYKALNRMASMGMLESEWEAAQIAENEGRPRRRLYRVTAEGARVLAAHSHSAVREAQAAARVGFA